MTYDHLHFIGRSRCTPQHMCSTTYAGCSPQHTPTIYQGTYVVGVYCGELYMLWVYVVGNIVKNGTCAPQHIICCGEHVHLNNIEEFFNLFERMTTAVWGSHLQH